jgi:hypothetical protein
MEDVPAVAQYIMFAIYVCFSAYCGVVLIAPTILFLRLKYSSRWKVPIKPRGKSDGWISIWHPNDEAIFGLQAIAKDSTEYVTIRAVSRAVDRYMMEFAVIGFAAVFVVPALLAIANNTLTLDLPYLIDGTAFIIALFLYFFVLFGFLLLSRSRYVGTLAAMLNKRTTGVIRSAAYGRDQPATLNDATTLPSQVQGIEICINGRLADQMADRALAKLLSYIKTHKRSLMVVNAAAPSAGVFAGMMDKMKGGELIHTSYFDHDEIVELIADHIARNTE